MGSKSKKHSKAQSKFSDQSLLTPPPHSEVSEDELQCTLDEASSKYPSLIGKSALIGRVANVQPNSRGCKIWLSEPSMVTLSIVPGSTVSVFLSCHLLHLKTFLGLCFLYSIIDFLSLTFAFDNLLGLCFLYSIIDF